MNLLWDIIYYFTIGVFIYYILQTGVYALITMAVFKHLIKLANRMKAVDFNQLVRTADAPPISLLVPAYNEELTCVPAIQALMSLRYPNYEILVINDGSNDGTMNKLIEAFQLEKAHRAPMSRLETAEVKQVFTSSIHPNLVVLDKANGGKADALNAGIKYCRNPLFCAMDADTVLDPDALIRVVLPFIEDKTVIATGGAIRIINGCDVKQGHIRKVAMPRNLLAGIQILEYVRAFMLGRLGWDSIGGMLIISGAFGLFKRDIVQEVGGFSTDTVGEDMELVVRLHRHCRETNRPYRITFVPEPVAWTECPETHAVLATQRERWQRGLIETMSRHRKVMLNPKHGVIGMVSFPYYALFEMASPIIEILGYVTLAIALAYGRVSLPFAGAFMLAAIGLGVVLSVASIALMELTYQRYSTWRELFHLCALAVVENFGFRQFMALVRFKGTFEAIRGKKGWGKMQRRGFSPQ